MSSTAELEVCYGIPCDYLGMIPHDELYVMSTEAKWPERRKAIVAAHPELFYQHVIRTPILDFGGSNERRPV